MSCVQSPTPHNVLSCTQGPSVYSSFNLFNAHQYLQLYHTLQLHAHADIFTCTSMLSESAYTYACPAPLPPISQSSSSIACSTYVPLWLYNDCTSPELHVIMNWTSSTCTCTCVPTHNWLGSTVLVSVTIQRTIQEQCNSFKNTQSLGHYNIYNTLTWILRQ